MKKVLYTLLAVSIVFAACKKEDDTPVVVNGCTDATQFNYNASANTDDRSCIAFVYGCMDSTQFNYNVLANTDDGSCISYVYGCMDSIATNYNALATEDDGTCTFGVVGGAWITNSQVLDIHAIVTYMGMVVFDSTWAEVENDPDSIEDYKIKYLDSGVFNEWDNADNETNNGTWVQSESTITKTDADTTMMWSIISLTKTSSVLEMTGNQTFTGDDGEKYDIDFSGTMSATRDENGFTSNTTNQRKSNTPWFNTTKLMNSIKQK